MNQYQSTRWAALSSWNPNGKGILMLTRFAETAQLHTVDFPGGDRKQITFMKEPIGGGSYCPDSTYKGFMFTRDTGGNEFSQLYWFDLNTGRYDRISDGGRSQNSLPNWSNKGDRFTTVSTRRNGKDFDIYLCSMKNPTEAKLVLQQGGSWSVQDWSPDDKRVVVQNYISVNKSFLHILDTETGKLEQINPSTEDIAYGGSAWSADGSRIFIISDQGSEFQMLKVYDVVSKKFTPITSHIPWDVSGLAINKSEIPLCSPRTKTEFPNFTNLILSHYSTVTSRRARRRYRWIEISSRG